MEVRTTGVKGQLVEVSSLKILDMVASAFTC